MTRAQQTTEDINRVLAEKVMGMELKFGDPLVDGCNPTECWYIEPKPSLSVIDFDAWNPCQNASQFNECFAKASEEVQSGAVFGIVGDPGLTLNTHDYVIKWQLAPTSEKSRCLYEAVMETE